MKKRSTSIIFVTAMVIAITSFSIPWKLIVAAKTVVPVKTSSAAKTEK